MQRHLRALGWILIVVSTVGIILTPLLGRVSMLIHEMLPAISSSGPATAQPHPLWAVTMAPELLTMEAVIVAVVSALCMVAGTGLLRRRRWARALTILASVLLLGGAPVGTIVGIYGLWLMLSYRGRQVWTGCIG